MSKDKTSAPAANATAETNTAQESVTLKKAVKYGGIEYAVGEKITVDKPTKEWLEAQEIV
jgi:hypothetical protein